MNYLPLSESAPMIWNGMNLVISSRATTPVLRALWGTDRFLRPAGRDVGHCQRVGVIIQGVTALVTDQVELYEPGHRVVPRRPGPDRDGVLEQRTRLAWCG